MIKKTDAEILKRYGIEWTSLKAPIAVPRKDGHWTAWHLAHEAIVEKDKRIAELVIRVKGLENELSFTKAKLAANNAEIGLYLRDVSFMSNNSKLADASIDKLERAVQLAIDTCCLDEKDESVLVDAVVASDALIAELSKDPK